MAPLYKGYESLGRYGTVGIELVISIGLGWWFGHWLDGKLGGGRGWFTAGGFAFGAFAGFRQLFIVARKRTREAEAEAERDRKAGVVLPTFLEEHDDHDVHPDEERNLDERRH
jgi:ATP synthase protein I